MIKLQATLFLCFSIIACDGSDSSEPALSGVEFLNKISAKWEVTCRQVAQVEETVTESRDISATQIIREGIAVTVGSCPEDDESASAYYWEIDILGITPEIIDGKQAYRVRLDHDGYIYEDLLYEEGGYLYVGDSSVADQNLILDFLAPYQRTSE